MMKNNENEQLEFQNDTNDTFDSSSEKAREDSTNEALSYEEAMEASLPAWAKFKKKRNVKINPYPVGKPKSDDPDHQLLSLQSLGEAAKRNKRWHSAYTIFKKLSEMRPGIWYFEFYKRVAWVYAGDGPVYNRIYHLMESLEDVMDQVHQIYGGNARLNACALSYVFMDFLSAGFDQTLELIEKGLDEAEDTSSFILVFKTLFKALESTEFALRILEDPCFLEKEAELSALGLRGYFRFMWRYYKGYVEYIDNELKEREYALNRNQAILDMMDEDDISERTQAFRKMVRHDDRVLKSLREGMDFMIARLPVILQKNQEIEDNILNHHANFLA